jgi:glycosyltransferase involved in cell wall biosynthesis
MMSEPTFSVVIANYNYRAFVAEAVRSALRQTPPPLEVIVVDDGSTDGSPEFLRREFGDEPAVKLVCQDNRGQLSAFAAGIMACQGAVVCLLDADDIWESGHLRALADAYAATPTLDCVFTNMRYFGSRQGLYDSRGSDYDYGLTALLTRFLARWVGVPTSALSMRRGLAQRIFLDLPPRYYREWWSDECMIYGGSIWGAHKKYLAAVTVGYRMHGKNASLQNRADAVTRLKDAYRLQRLLAHFANAAALDAGSLRMIKHEFKTKPRPSREELSLYLQLLRRTPFGLFKRIEIGLSMCRYYRRQRRGGA